MAVVKINGEEKVIPRLVAEKAIRITDAIAEGLAKAPEILDEYKKLTDNYPPIAISAQEAQLPNWQPIIKSLGYLDDNGEIIAAAINEEGKVSIPQAPSDEEVLARMFPIVWGTLKEELLRIIALLLVSGEDLREADRSDAVEELLQEVADDLAYNADLEELVAVVAVGIELISAEIKRAGVGKLLEKTRALTTGQQTEEEPETATEEPAS